MPGSSASGTSFEEWAVENGLPEDADTPDDNPDGDALPNILEFFFGTDPLRGEPYRGVVADATPPESDGAGEPNGGAIVLTYAQALKILGITPIIEESQDLRTWTEADMSLATVSEEDTETRRVVHVSFPYEGHRYYRLKVVLDQEQP